ncbi:MAG: PD40 domain-containing protein, partial [Deltaproteobacteria bacterium]|nr:PD40 domain-containing protein [Deltaproteobacteria bacterium]
TWWVRAFGSLEAVEIELAALAQDFIFSPDGQSIAYRRGNWIGSLTVETLARDRRDVVFESALGPGLDWSSDGWIYFTSSIDQGLGRVSADGARSESLTKLDQSANEFRHGFPDALPGGAAVLFTIGYTNRASIEDTQIAVLDLATGEVKKLVRGLRPRFVDSGHLVFVRADGAVMAAAFDPESLEFEGTPVQVAGAANVGAFGKQADLDATLAGTLIYVSASPEPVDDLVWISRSGAVEHTDSSWEGRPRFPSLSADGGYLAATVHRGRLPPNVWLKQLPDGHLRRLTHGNTLDYRPRWTSDGTAIVHVGPRPPDRLSWDMYQTDITTGIESRLLEEGEIADASWSRDGQWIVYSDTDSGDLFAAREGALDSLLPLSASPVFIESDPELSPDGRWLAFESDESGSREIWVQPFPEADGNRQQVSPSGGREQLWANSGRELFYVNAAGQLVSAELASGATFEIREHRVLFSVADYLWEWGYDVTRDDDQFIFIRRGPTLAPVILVQNLGEELKLLVPTER